MQALFSSFRNQISRTESAFVRYIYPTIGWHNRLIAIIGSRGVGKTTILFQYIKNNYDINSGEILYVSLDHIWFSTNSLVDLAEEFSQNGGKILFLDEVHKYPTWSQEIKNIYDSYPDLKIVFTGSSMLEITRATGDLSRRMVEYTLQGMSFREFLELEYGLKMETIMLDDIFKNHVALASEIGKKVKPMIAFKEYLKYGYFPFYKEDKETYHHRLLSVLNTIIEVDLPASKDIEYQSIIKIKKLFSILSTLVPFTPNISQLAVQINTTRTSLMNYLQCLEKAKAILMLNNQTKGMRQLLKPEKIYLGNTNYAYALGGESVEIGTIRETFFFTALEVGHEVNYSDKTDFLINHKYSIEVGGKDKTAKQIMGLNNSFVVKDNIEVGYANHIPLWLFGFLY